LGPEVWKYRVPPHCVWRNCSETIGNPLGIIALFIVLVYGIAALVLAASADNLAPDERLPLVWFLVVFPGLVLGVFYRLVSKHHVKLYAPEDFRDENGFFRALSPEEQRVRLEAAVREMDESEKSRLNLADSAALLGSISARHSYVLAEELSFREIEAEFGVKIHRQVAIGRSNYGVDGVFLQSGRMVGIEIKYIRESKHIRTRLRHTVEQLSRVAGTQEPALRFIIVLVIDESKQSDNTIHDEWTRIRAECGFDGDLRIYHFGELKSKYGVSVNGA
jgi:hypothetical protein